jgi:hypothetical protein
LNPSLQHWSHTPAFSLGFYLEDECCCHHNSEEEPESSLVRWLRVVEAESELGLESQIQGEDRQGPVGFLEPGKVGWRHAVPESDHKKAS